MNCAGLKPMAEGLLSNSETFNEVAHNSWFDSRVPGRGRL